MPTWSFITVFICNKTLILYAVAMCPALGDISRHPSQLSVLTCVNSFQWDVMKGPGGTSIKACEWPFVTLHGESFSSHLAPWNVLTDGMLHGGAERKEAWVSSDHCSSSDSLTLGFFYLREQNLFVAKALFWFLLCSQIPNCIS